MKTKFSILLFALLIILFVVSGCSNNPKNDEQEKLDEGYGCCAPFCSLHEEGYCSDLGGSWTPSSCSSVDECKIGCCVPICEETSKGFCEMSADEWRDGTCEQQPECEIICCDPYDAETTKVLCEQIGGTPNGAACNKEAIEANVVIEIKETSSCNCNDEGKDGSYIMYNCDKSNNVVERITFSADKDSLKKERGGEYSLQGTARYELFGNSKHSLTKESNVPCLNDLPAIPSTSITDQTDTRRFSESEIEDATLTFEIIDGAYFFSLYLDSQFEVNSQRNFRRSISNHCKNSNPSPPQADTYEEPYQRFTGTSFSGNSLSGYNNFEYYGQYGFYCGTSHPKADTKITWNLDWVDS